jgi:hypothetical protein
LPFPAAGLTKENALAGGQWLDESAPRFSIAFEVREGGDSE